MTTPLAPARGIVIALAISIDMWAFVAWYALRYWEHLAISGILPLPELPRC